MRILSSVFLTKAALTVSCNITKFDLKVEFAVLRVYNDMQQIKKDDKYGKRKHFKKRQRPYGA